MPNHIHRKNTVTIEATKSKEICDFKIKRIQVNNGQIDNTIPHNKSFFGEYFLYNVASPCVTPKITGSKKHSEATLFAVRVNFDC